MISRRRFVENSALVASALALPWPFARGAHSATPTSLLDDLITSQFLNDLPNPLNPGFIFTPRGRSRYEIGTAETMAAVLGTKDPSLPNGPFPLTTVWGYQNNLFSEQGPTYPGRTIEAFFRRGSQVRWANRLPPDHPLPVDKSIHWADPEGTGRLLDPRADPTGLESVIVTHLHGGRNQSDSDGLPEYWFGPDFDVVGLRWTKRDYVYPNEFEARTLWYHDHALGITRLNVYAGLAGFYILRDDADTGQPDNPLNLPTFPYEVPIVIQDRCFDAQGQLFLPADFERSEDVQEDEGLFFITDEDGRVDFQDWPATSSPTPSIVAEFFGDVIVVNGKAWPKLQVEPRNYRLRFLNGSDSRFYVLMFQSDAENDGEIVTTTHSFHVIGTDQGLLNQPVLVSQLLVGPGERYDVVFDFDSKTEVFLRNFGPDDPFGGFPIDTPADSDTTGQVMLFDVSLSLHEALPEGVEDRPDDFNHNDPLRSDEPTDPRSPVINEIDIDPGPPVTVRRLGLFEGLDQFGRLQPLLGAETEEDVIESLIWADPITENPGVGDVEEWEVYNATEDAHPIHLHLVRFRIVNREGFTGTLTTKQQQQHDGSTGVGLKLTNIVLDGNAVAPGEDDPEFGWKDTAVMLPGQVTRIRAKFDRPGRYVWHCHILSHEDHEMMRPYHVGPVPPGD